MRKPRQNKILSASESEMRSPYAAINGVACSSTDTPGRAGFRDSSGTNDSKCSDAATLAIDLASNSSWSEVLSTPSISTQGSANSDSMNSPKSDHSNSHMLPSQTELVPPPEYSPSSDLTPDSGNSDSEIMRHAPLRREMEASTQLTYGDVESDNRRDLDAPFLGDASETAPNYPWMRTSRIASFRKHRLWWLHAVMLLVVVLTTCVLLAIFVDYDQTVSSQPNLPLISTERIHIQHETFKDIRGRFELYDKLELSTTTGTIDIQIDLQPGDSTVQLILNTDTGAITLGISNSWWLRGNEKALRPIHTEIETVTGKVLASILLGQGGYASIDSVTGEQNLRIFVYDATPDQAVSELITRSNTGNQVVALTHFGAPNDTISSLKAKHHSQATASLDLQYPRAWRGEVHAVASAIGKVEVQRSEGLVFDKNQVHEILAHRGNDNPRQTIDVMTDGTGSGRFKS